MNSANSTISQLREMISIEENRDELVRQIKALDARLVTLRNALDGGRTPVPEKPDLSGAKSASRAGHGSLKREILGLLQKAGVEGISVREVSSFLNIKAANIYAWFHSTGRSVPQISKIGEARYALNGELPPEPEPKPKRVATPREPGAGQPRGGLTRKIFASLEQVGEQGATVKELAERVESNYRNVAVWFATTGKKFPNLHKMAPARYRLENAPSAVESAPEASEAPETTPAHDTAGEHSSQPTEANA